MKAHIESLQTYDSEIPYVIDKDRWQVNYQK